ncbi:hypothetical protein B0T17DRAFT_532659 [Bombardia bombarda]|uniref:Uncharacterized protein n=1 Tax=Bombardia bombarda TaxID=252184 RepID=A0AA39X158_9PEZI|nr:hypothetical protein B0T17DRAFT_532659 [Bombardia bombarda]
MADQTVVYISGVSKGIGKSLLGHYLSLPNHIVIGSIRDKTAPYVAELTALPTAPGSRLALVRVESTSPTDAVEAVKEAVSTLGIDKIDIVIANAGGARYTEEALVPLHEMTIEWTKEVFDLNTLGPVLLFQATRALLQKSKKPVWVTVSSAAGSIEAIEGYGTHRIPAYGMAKAAVNWATVAMHSGNEWLIALAVHPG